MGNLEFSRAALVHEAGADFNCDGIDWRTCQQWVAGEMQYANVLRLSAKRLRTCGYQRIQLPNGTGSGYSSIFLFSVNVPLWL